MGFIFLSHKITHLAKKNLSQLEVMQCSYVLVIRDIFRKTSLVVIFLLEIFTFWKMVLYLWAKAVDFIIIIFFKKTERNEPKCEP